MLKKQIAKKHIWMDFNIVKFVTNYQYKKSDTLCPIEDKIKIIQEAIKNKSSLSIIYLKANDEKTQRLIEPIIIGKMQYLNKAFTGVKAFCLKRQEY